MDVSDIQHFFFRRKAGCFLVDRTIGRIFGTPCYLSVWLSVVVMFCIVAIGKMVYILAKNCLKEQIGNQDQKLIFLGRRHISTSGFAWMVTKMAVFALFLPVQLSDQY